MNEKDLLTRRQFVTTAGKAAVALGAFTAVGPAVLGSRKPGETIGVGLIGVGTRGGDDLKGLLYVDGVKVVALCDVYKPHLQKGLEFCKAVEGYKTDDIKTYVDYHDLLADKRVDAIVIAVPDHWHPTIVMDAVVAGKDIYCEKGWSRTIEDAKRMREAIKKAGTVFQLGHQARQATCAMQAKEIIASGVLGDITHVRTGRFGNLPAPHAIWRWYGYYDKFDRPDPKQVEKDVDWKRWLGPAEQFPFNERHFWHWRCYWRYGTGQAGDVLSHELDFVQYLLGHGIPDACMCAGMNARLRDDREVPDTWIANYTFEKAQRTVTFTGCQNNSAMQPIELCGQEATLRFDGIAHDATSFQIIPEKFNQKADLPKRYMPGKTPAQPNHLEDFFNCVRSRKLPKCNVDEAFVETATYLMSVESFNKKREVRWDPVKEEIV